MEFTHIGAHCSLPDCKQLDFLPFNCESCHKKFCGDHRKEVDHHCESYKEKKAATTLNCVLCNQVLVVKSDQDPNLVVDMHITQGGCTKQQTKTINKHKCTKCGKFGMTEIICRDCGNNYCLTHRFTRDHSCTMSLRKPTNMIGPFRVPISVKS
eukprot:Phypoly_transcript_23405.p1 GENE.Phypoly_transcript_23405~~Phypoly_transcript_23405.p1  ORF type:complete len:173 (+),score=21.36 Phypoly_transcript_23405:60-521(+)